MNGISLEEKNNKGETFYDILQKQMPRLHEKGNPDYYKSISPFVKNIPHKLEQLQNAIQNNDTIDLLKKALVEGDIVFAQKIASNPLHFGAINKNDIEFLEKVSQNSHWQKKEAFENITNTLKANALLQNKGILVENDLDEALKKGDYILSKQLIKAGVPLSDFAQQKLQKDPVLHATLYNPVTQKEHKKALEIHSIEQEITKALNSGFFDKDKLYQKIIDIPSNKHQFFKQIITTVKNKLDNKTIPAQEKAHLQDFLKDIAQRELILQKQINQNQELQKALISTPLSEAVKEDKNITQKTIVFSLECAILSHYINQESL